MYDVAQIPRVCTPAFRALLVGKYLDEREIIYRCRVPAHFQPRIEKVVFLVGFFGVLFDLLVVEYVAALLANLGYNDYAKFKAPGVRVVLQDLLTESEDVKIENVSVPATFDCDFREKVCRPHRKVARINTAVVLSYGVVCNNKAAFYDVDKIELCIAFENVKQPPYTKPVIIGKAVALAVISV